MNILFFGTSEFAVPALEALIKNSLSPKLVITLPDRPQGRGLHSLPSPVKRAAQNISLEIAEPDKLSDPEFLTQLSETAWDVGVVAAYGKFIPESILNMPKKGVINIHPSLLPELRGPSPIESAIVEGKQETGVTIMLTDAEMDHGPILMQERIRITPDETAKHVEQRCADIGARLLVTAIPRWLNGTLTPQEQDHSRATFSKKIKKEDGNIRWDEPAGIIHRKIRAYTPWPGTYTFWENKKSGRNIRLKILAAAITKTNEQKPPGLVQTSESDMIVLCGKDALTITTLQPEGKTPISGGKFLRGYPSIKGALLH